MYHHVRGSLFRLGPSEAIVEAGGVGYRVEIAFPVYKALESRVGEEVLLYVLPHIREESQRLFGFLSEEDREFFRVILFPPIAVLTSEIAPVGNINGR